MYTLTYYVLIYIYIYIYMYTHTHSLAQLVRTVRPRNLSHCCQFLLQYFFWKGNALTQPQAPKTMFFHSTNYDDDYYTNEHKQKNTKRDLQSIKETACTALCSIVMHVRTKEHIQTVIAKIVLPQLLRALAVSNE